MDWTGSHMDDEDYEEELFLVGEQPGVKDAKAPSNLSLEERMQKAKELQEKVRAKRAAEEIANEKEREAARKLNDKEAMKMKRVLEE